VLAGEDAQARRRLVGRPLEHPEARLGRGAVRQLDRAAEVERPDAGHPAARQLGDARRGIIGAQCGALDPLTGRKPGPALCVVRRVGDDAEQLEIVRAEHHRVVGGAHVGAVGAARRQREAEPSPGIGGGIEAAHHDHNVVEAREMSHHGRFITDHWSWMFRGSAGHPTACCADRATAAPPRDATGAPDPPRAGRPLAVRNH